MYGASLCELIEIMCCGCIIQLVCIVYRSVNCLIIYTSVTNFAGEDQPKEPKEKEATDGTTVTKKGEGIGDVQPCMANRYVNFLEFVILGYYD